MQLRRQHPSPMSTCRRRKARNRSRRCCLAMANICQLHSLDRWHCRLHPPLKRICQHYTASNLPPHRCLRNPNTCPHCNQCTCPRRSLQQTSSICLSRTMYKRTHPPRPNTYLGCMTGRPCPLLHFSHQGCMPRQNMQEGPDKAAPAMR